MIDIGPQAMTLAMSSWLIKESKETSLVLTLSEAPLYEPKSTKISIFMDRLRHRPDFK